MKLFLPIALGITSLGLAIALYMMNQNDTAQHESDVSTITDFSNRVDIAQLDIAGRVGTLVLMTNSLDVCQSAWADLSNQLTAANSSIALDAAHITSLNRQIVAMTDEQSKNQTLDQRHMLDLTNHVDGLERQLTLTQTNLVQTNQNLVQLGKDYVLLENRFRIDVGERTVAERKLGNLMALKAQMKLLKLHPASEVSDGSIYAGLDVEVRSNGTFHVIEPN